MSEFVVCPDCRGHGTDSKQELVFTSDDLDEWYGDDSDERRQFIENYRTGAYSHPCRTCHGQRVIPTAGVDEVMELLEARWEWDKSLQSRGLGHDLCPTCGATNGVCGGVCGVAELPLHRTEAGWPNCATCDGGGCPDCTDPA